MGTLREAATAKSLAVGIGVVCSSITNQVSNNSLSKQRRAPLTSLEEMTSSVKLLGTVVRGAGNFGVDVAVGTHGELLSGRGWVVWQSICVRGETQTWRMG